MEIDKKIVKKLIDALEDLKKSVKGSNEDFSTDQTVFEEIEEINTIKSPTINK